MSLKDAYREVYNDMLNSGCGLLVGKYDAKHGNEHFMFGIATVMELIANKVSDADYNAFNDMFTQNMIDSERKAGAK